MKILNLLREKNKNTVFFDYDNTLVLSKRAYIETYIELFKKQGRIVDAQEISKHFGKPAFQIIKAILGNISDKEIQELIKEREKILLTQKISKIKLIDGTFDLLKLLRQENIYIGIVSSSTRKVLIEFSKYLGILKFFDIIVTADDIKIGKPDPEPFLVALEKSKKSGSECIAVGDTVYDIISAKKAGLFTIGIAWDKKTYEEMVIAGADVIVEELKELLK